MAAHTLGAASLVSEDPISSPSTVTLKPYAALDEALGRQEELERQWLARSVDPDEAELMGTRAGSPSSGNWTRSTGGGARRDRPDPGRALDRRRSGRPDAARRVFSGPGLPVGRRGDATGQRGMTGTAVGYFAQGKASSSATRSALAGGAFTIWGVLSRY